jgi:hypothetical protein
MKRELYLLFGIIACTSYGSELSHIDWAPPFDNNHTGDLKMMLLIEGDFEKIKQCYVPAKIEDQNQLSRSYDTLEDAMYLCHSYDAFVPDPNQKMLSLVYQNDVAFMFPIDWNEEEKKVTFAGGYSHNLYNFLDECGIIASANSPDVILFSSDPELSEIKFVPMPQYAGCNGNLEKVVFLEGDKFDFIFNRTENLKQLAEIIDPNELNKIKHAFSSADYCLMHILEGLPLIETAIGFIYEDNRGELFIIDPDRKKKIVEFEGGYSKELYDILIYYGIIKSD